MRILKIIFIIFLITARLEVHAEEGMWLPQLLKQLNEKDMQSLGMQISAEDIYSINKSSLKDAIVSFNGGCTGEIISAEGLLLTNHHCGYGQIQSHSSVDKDYLTDGFWAMTKEEELPNPDLYVSFIVSIEDVTVKLTKGLDTLEPRLFEDSVKARIPQFTQMATKGTDYEAIIKPFFYGNKYYMFLTETYRDVRLVGAPPSSIGKFGGDTDNWVWPRHTGDFSMFRVYMSPDGKPATYSKKNIPLKPKYFLPINIGGVQEGDFSMVFGFPGRTQEYLSSYAISSLIKDINPVRIQIRKEKLDIMKAHMDTSDKVRIQYASKYARVANYYKKWIGENRGLKISKAIEIKEKEEKAFQTWADKQSDAAYKTVLSGLNEIDDKLNTYELAYQYMREAVFGVEVFSIVNRIDRMSKKNDQPRVKAVLDKFHKDYDSATDKALFVRMMEIYASQVNEDFQPKLFLKYKKKYKGNYQKMANDLFKKIAIIGDDKGMSLYHNRKKLKKEPIIKLAREFSQMYYKQVLPQVIAIDSELGALQKIYLKGMMTMKPKEKFYPDANSTMRVTYGLIDGNAPEDGVRYTFQTTLEGMIRKSETGNPDFLMPEKLKDLYENKDYGDYAENDKMPVCFLASNHTTGGNSGSPIIDAHGNLIGLNFDRTWQSTMSDVMYNANICRNIGVDIRYILFIIDKYAGAKNLISEMKILKVKSKDSIEAEEKAKEESEID